VKQVLRDLRVFRAILALPGPQAQRVLPVRQALQEKQGHRDRKARQEF
jgi:hypothetical protein